MGLRELHMLKTHFNLVVDKSSSYEYLYRTMFWFLGSFWALVCTHLSYVFGFVIRHVYRYKRHENRYSVIAKEDGQIISNSEVKSSLVSEYSKKCDDFQESREETDSLVYSEDVSSSNTSKYQFMSGRDISGFMEEAETMSFTVQELFVSPEDDSFYKPHKLFEDENQLLKLNSGTHAADQERAGDGFKDFEDDEQFLTLNLGIQAVDQQKAGDGFMEEPETMSLAVQELFVFPENVSISKSQSVFEDDNQFMRLNSGTQDADQQKAGESAEEEEREYSEDELPEEGAELRNDPINCLDPRVDVQFDNSFFSFYMEPSIIDSSDETTAEIGYHNLELDEGEFESSTIIAKELENDRNLETPEETPEDEYINFEPREEILSRQNFGKAEEEHDCTGIVHEETERVNDWEEESSSDSDDDLGFNFRKEQQELIDQIKMEMKYAKTGGLPTISEESESPKMADDLKPLKLEKKIEHKDLMEEIQKFYKSYALKMRKLDILNRQTMHAVGILRLKDPSQFASSKKSSFSAMTSLIARNIRPSKVANHEADSAQKYIRELHRAFELVYIGQVCLSWEILAWQHGKARELQHYDPDGYRQYNHVADEFQQFQVVLQRFTENERFQGPRIQNYVEKRCTFGTLLQVPAIRDDSLKDKKVRKEEEGYVIPIGSVTEIVLESMRIFWEFLRGDKDDIMISTYHVNLQDPADTELWMEIKANFQKKDKRLKELLRSRGCIVKKLQKRQEDRLGRALFLAQVEMKLVSRVLNMSKLTRDQLVWCQTKLDEINLVSRSVTVESTFLLFPC